MAGPAVRNMSDTPQIHYVTATGDQVVAVIDDRTVDLAMESTRPVRCFGKWQHKRHMSGRWSTSTSGGVHVGHESLTERDALMLLDFRSDVVAIASQPFAILWAYSGAKKDRYPDYFARLADGIGAVVRTMTCVAQDGTTTMFTGEEVRRGNASPSMWRNVTGTGPAGFNFHSVTVVAPDGTVTESFGNAQGVERNKDLVTCSFIIPVGPNIGRTVYFEGFFVPAN